MGFLYLVSLKKIGKNEFLLRRAIIKLSKESQKGATFCASVGKNSANGRK